MNVSEFNKDDNLNILHSMCQNYAKNKYNIDYNTSSPIYENLLSIINYTNINKYKFKKLLDMNKYTINEFDNILSQYAIKTQVPYNNSNNLQINVTENKQLYRPKEEYKELMNDKMNSMKEEFDMLANPKKPPSIDFTDNENNEEDNIDYKLKEEISKRELEYNSVINSLPYNNSSSIKIHHSTDIPLISNKKNVSFNNTNNDSNDSNNINNNYFLNKLKVLSPISNENNENNESNKSNENNKNNNFDENYISFKNFIKNQNEINNNLKKNIELLQEKINSIENKLDNSLNFSLEN